MIPQKNSDSLGNLCVKETNVDGALGLLLNEFFAFDTRLNSGKMNIGFDSQYGHISHDGFNGQYGYNNHNNLNGQDGHT